MYAQKPLTVAVVHENPVIYPMHRSKYGSLLDIQEM